MKSGPILLFNFQSLLMEHRMFLALFFKALKFYEGVVPEITLVTLNTAIYEHKPN